MTAPRVNKVEGVILKRRNVGEADRILTIFSRQYGKMRVLAKGVRRISSRRAGHLEVFTHVVLTIHMSRTMDMVTEASAIRNGSLFDADAVRLGYAYCMCELVDQLLADHQEHEEVFFLIRDALMGLLKTDTVESYQQILTDFTHELLWRLGFLPQAKQLQVNHMQEFVENITERHLRAWPHLTEI
jgi:DNA repair protein RecO (recombination protein O)